MVCDTFPDNVRVWAHLSCACGSTWSWWCLYMNAQISKQVDPFYKWPQTGSLVSPHSHCPSRTCISSYALFLTAHHFTVLNIQFFLNMDENFKLWPQSQRTCTVHTFFFQWNASFLLTSQLTPNPWLNRSRNISLIQFLKKQFSVWNIARGLLSLAIIFVTFYSFKKC